MFVGGRAAGDGGLAAALAAEAEARARIKWIPEYGGYRGHHSINKWEYVLAMVETVQSGGEVPPYVVCDDRKCLCSGHHRAAANAILEMIGCPRRIGTVNHADVRDDPDWFSKFG